MWRSCSANYLRVTTSCNVLRSLLCLIRERHIHHRCLLFQLLRSQYRHLQLRIKHTEYFRVKFGTKVSLLEHSFGCTSCNLTTMFGTNKKVTRKVKTQREKENNTKEDEIK